MANLEAISYINLGDGNHPIDAVTVGGKTVPDVSNFITKSVNDLTNYYLKTETYTKSEVEDLIGAILQFHYEIAASTSAVTSPESNVLYLIGPTGDGADKYEEYVYPNSTAGWTKIGDTTIDLAGYVTTEMLNDTLEDYRTSSEIEEMELVIAGALNDLNERLVYIEESVFPDVSNQLYDVNSSISSLDSRVSTLETNASSYLTSESDPVFSASPASSITNANISSWNAKQNALVYDSVPTANSSNMVKSGDLYTVIVENEEVTAAALINLDGRVQTLESNTLTSESDPVYSASVAATITASDISSWNAKQDALVYDSVPTENSDNLVKSGALYSVITHNEYVVATAINDLNDRVEVLESSPVSAVTASDIANWNSTASALSNYVTTSDYDDDQEVIATAMNDLNDRVRDLEESTESDPVFMSSVAASITASDISNWNSTASALSNYVTVSDLVDDEEVISTAINDLNDRLEVVESSPASAVTASDIANWNSMASSLSNYVTISDLEDNEYVIAQTLNNLNDRVTTLESNSGVSSSESDPIFTASVAASITASDISNWNSKTSNTGTVTGSSLTADKIVLGNGSSAIKTSTYSITTAAPSSGSTNDTIPTSSAVYSAIDTALTTVLKYKGTIGTGGTVTSLPASHKVGDVYVVSVSGTYAGKACEVGDYIICKTAGTSANNAHWDVVNGENQVDNKSASLANAGSSATIATVDGTDITVTTPATWTGLTKTGTITGISMNGASKGTSGNVDLGTVITAVSFNNAAVTVTSGAISISESDPVFAASVAASISAADISNWNSKTSNTGTITGISMNGSSKGTSGNVNLGTVVTGISMNNAAVTITSGVANLGTVLTSHQSIKTINSQAVTGTGNLTIREMPSVSSADNGKVLQVVNGSWTLVSPATIISGSGTPSNSTGNDGDLYLQTS